MTVAVIEQTDSSVSSFSEKDVDIEWFSGTGAGGQHRNKHQNSCRAVHRPTGVVATAQTRDRTSSKMLALTELKKKVDTASRAVYLEDRSSDRAAQRGSGMRGDKIRTYRFQDDTVTDHRSSRSEKCSRVMRGFFEGLWS